MGFLTPFLLLGAFALALPIWLHLRDRRANIVVKLPTFRFLEGAAASARSQARLRDPLLFLVRALTLIAIVLAFSRPWISNPEAIGVTESHVLILDNTLSHQVDGGFQRDRERIAATLASAGRNVQHAVVEVGATPRVVLRFGDDPANGATLVRALDPSNERGSYLAAARLASSLLDRALGDRRVIVFYGDNQKNQWTEAENALPFLEGVEVEVAEAPSADAQPNLSIAFPEARRAWAGDGARIELAFQLRHTDADIVRLEVRSNGRVLSSEAVELPSIPEGASSGSHIVRKAWKADPGAWVGGSVSVSGGSDALVADNEAWFAAPPLMEGRVALLARSRYLATSLQPEVMHGRWRVESLSPRGVDEPGADDDVLLVEASYLPGASVRDRISGMLATGRGVVVVLDRTSPLIVDALRELGVQLAGSAEVGPLVEDASMFRYVASHHPIFRPFLSGGLGELNAARVHSYFRISTEGLQSIVYSAAGDPLVAEVSRARGRLLVVAFPFARSHTTWPLQTSFVPFIDQLLDYARNQDVQSLGGAPGEWTTIPIERGQSPERIVVSGRNGFREVLDASDQESVRFRNPSQPGLYEVRFDDTQQLQRLVAVNAAAEESVLEYEAEPRALSLWSRPEAPEARASALSGGPPFDASGQLWWRRLLLVALALTGVELIILCSNRDTHAAA